MHKYLVSEMGRQSVQQFKQSKKLPLVVILDNVRSMYNVGSVFRTCDAYRVKKVFLCGVSATPPNAEIHKTALGAEDSVEWQHASSASSVISSLKALGYTVFAVEQVRGSIPPQALDLSTSGNYAVVLGHEVFGVSQEAVDSADFCLELPQFGTKHSLNVSVTCGIVIWEFYRRLASLLV